MEGVFEIAETITAENEPASQKKKKLKNERVKETNPRKGTETLPKAFLFEDVHSKSKRN